MYKSDRNCTSVTLTKLAATTMFWLRQTLDDFEPEMLQIVSTGDVQPVAAVPRREDARAPVETKTPVSKDSTM